MPVSPDEGARRLAALGVALGSDEAASAFATAWLHEAVAVGNTKPTPQARMAAEGLRVEGTHLVGPAQTLVGRGVPLGDILFGSEFGSNIYTQFGPRQQHGYWLFRSADDPNVMEAYEVEFVDKAIGVATRG